MLAVDITGAVPSGLARSRVAALATRAFAAAGGTGDAAVSIAVVGDRAMRSLNRRHRGKDKVTDVLSFGYAESGPAFDAVGRRHAVLQLGDIVICLPQVRRQAARVGKRVRDEFALMVVHGVLHLMGYDHETERDERTMFRLQQDILFEAGII